MSAEKARVFKETYEHYLKEISGADFGQKAGMLGVEHQGNTLVIPYYGRDYTVSSSGVYDQAGNMARFAISVVLLKYVLMCPEKEPKVSEEWITYRDFKDAGPLISYFTANTNKTIENAFARHPDLLEKACREMNAVQGGFTTSYDVSMKLHALPKLPVIINFNARDEEFPAACSILFQRAAQYYLDMECVAITGTYLAGTLLAAITDSSD